MHGIGKASILAFLFLAVVLFIQMRMNSVGAFQLDQENQSIALRPSMVSTASIVPRVPGAVRRVLTTTGPIRLWAYDLSDVSRGDGDGRADPGESISMTVALFNEGETTFEGGQVALATTVSYVALTTTSPLTWGTLAAGQVATMSVPFRFRLDSQMPRGSVVSFTVAISTEERMSYWDTLRLPVGWWYVQFSLLLRNYVHPRVPNDVYYALQWALPKVNAPRAWSLSSSNSDVIIAIIDSGVDLDHPDLNEKLWLNSDEVPGNGLDDDENGFVDDVCGYDFWYNDPDPNDDHGHGTQVAGVAAAATDNGIGIAALGWDSALMPLKTQSSSGLGTTNELAEAIVYAVDNGASVINLSVGQELSMCPAVLQVAIDYAAARDVLVVAAVGNKDQEPNKAFYPAACENVLGVGVTDNLDRCLSPKDGEAMDVVAPGRSVLSTLPGGEYSYGSGASMAAPLVSALAALVYDRYSEYGDEEVAWAILSHVVDLGSTGWDDSCGWGRVDAFHTLSRGATGTPTYQEGNRGPVRFEAIAASFAPGKLLVGLETDAGNSLPQVLVADELFDNLGLWGEVAIPDLGIWRLQVPQGKELFYVQALQEYAQIAFVELEYYLHLAE